LIVFLDGMGAVMMDFLRKLIRLEDKTKVSK
jgi:hypothetical protein